MEFLDLYPDPKLRSGGDVIHLQLRNFGSGYETRNSMAVFNMHNTRKVIWYKVIR